MFITLIFIIMIIVGAVMLKHNNEIVSGIGLLTGVIGIVVTFAMVVCIAIAHIGVDAQIEENRIEYESLCKRNEIVSSNYEDVSRSEVIKDIAEWNKRVYSAKRWCYSPWTSWFYSREVVDEVKMIE